MPAFRRAIQLGAHGIELDVHLSADGHVMVIHDETVNRTTNGRGRVHRLTQQQLRTLDASGGRGSFTPIPLLSEVLELLAGSEVALNIEIKTDKVEQPGLEQAVVGLVAQFDVAVIISSFNMGSLAQVRALGPHLETAWLYTGRVFGPQRVAKRLRTQGIHPPFRACTSRLLAAAHEAGLQVRPWTVDKPATISRLAAAGANAIITNDPATALTLI